MSKVAGQEFSAALEASHVFRGGDACKIAGWGCSVRVDASAPSATYWLQWLDTAAGALPGDGAVTHRMAPTKVVHTNGTDDQAFFSFGDTPIPCPNGLCLVLSTTETAKTIAGAYMKVSGVETQ